jgi:mono/diheme cytochrome c family protein
MSEQTPHSHDEPQLPLDAPAELPLPPLPRPPFWMVSLAVISVVVTWLPLALIARARATRSTEPRIQIMQDMGVQPKYKEQATDSMFADDRAMRPRIPGTVARGEADLDDTFVHGFTRVFDASSGAWKVQFADDLPAQFTDTPEHLEKLLRRGQQRFNIYCYVCHGLDGSGQGPVNERAMELQADGVAGMSWTPAAVLTADLIRAEPDGKIFNTITNGIRSMPSYGAQIPVSDRWAIVSYVRALQFSQKAPTSVVPKDKLDALQGQ